MTDEHLVDSEKIDASSSKSSASLSVAAIAQPSKSQLAIAWEMFKAHRVAFASLVVLLLLVVSVIVGPWVVPHDPIAIDFTLRDQSPSWVHPMGTDELGRDQLARVLQGGRLSLLVAGTSVSLAIVVGVLVGSIAGYAGPLIDNLLMRIVDVFYSLPGLFVAILLVTMIGPDFWTIVIAIGALRWMGAARLVRASFLSLREKEYIEAARSSGARPLRIIFVHLLPNALSPIFVACTLGVAGALLTESALSFLGLGFQPPDATWGRLLSESQRAVISDGHWWRGFFPGMAIFVTILSFNFVGDGLRDAADPKFVNR